MKQRQGSRFEDAVICHDTLFDVRLIIEMVLFVSSCIISCANAFILYDC